ncbi:MAG: Crp/Fnr family transcriptional regulator [Bacteroidia bacterium]|nr:Crp/Fnr family transcriptional regulator [Bacteroidia bacterium]
MQYSNPHIELCLEGSSSIFKGLNQKDKETIALHHTLHICKKGELLFKTGDKPRGLICLASGKVKVFKEGVGGREQILKMVKKQGFIGYRALFSDNAWSISAASIEDSAIVVFEKNSFIKILKKNADLALKFIKVITEELEFSNNRTVSLSQKHVRGRLAESLLALRDTYGYEGDGKTICISLSRDDIAHLSNMTTSNAIRTLSSLASEGIIEIKRRKISIVNSSRLKDISESA